MKLEVLVIEPVVGQRRNEMVIFKVIASGRVQSLGLLYMTYACHSLLAHLACFFLQGGP